MQNPDGPSLPSIKRPGCLLWIGAVFLLFVFLSALARPYTEWLWFVHDGRHPEVFATAYATRSFLFSVSFVFATALFALCFLKALTVGQVFSRIPQSIAEVTLVRALDWIQKHASGAAKLASVVLGLFFAIGFSREWNTYLLWKNAQPFGVNDPTFGRDLGFFVFELPWLTALLQFVSSLFLLASLVTLGIYSGLGAVAKLGKIELNAQSIRGHMCLLVGLTFIAFGALAWVKRYEFGLMDSPQFTGAGYAAMQKLAVQGWLSILSIVVGIITLVSFRSRGAYGTPIAGALAIGAVYLLAMVAWPLFVQRITVEPNKLDKESPYAANSIKMTRWAFGLGSIEVRPTDVQDSPSSEEVSEASATLASMRLWDPEILRRTIEVLQGLRPYYAFNDVDVDRYMIDGKPTPVMLAPRDIRREGLTATARTWLNTTLQYTHGYGVAMTAVNSSTSNGRPVFLIKDFPPKTPKDVPLTQPRIYFSDIRDAFGNPADEYVLVDTKVQEFDYPVDTGDKTNRWTGGRGVPLNSGLAKLTLGMVLGDGNLLVSPNVTEESRVLFHRSVLDRCNTLFPFLRFDDDPYVVLLDGRILWVIDAYTTTDMVPYSDFPALGGRTLNYIRNSVKVTVDAYTGETIAYAVQPNEPILKAYRKIYPKLIQDVSAMPKGLREHWRYPEDLFRLQAQTLTQYHVTDPVIFLNNSDAWELPVETNPDGNKETMKPYYVQMRLPDEAREGFMLILPFTPRQKPNMSGWLAAHCDPEDYGKMLLYEYPKGSNMPGPAQMESNISQNPDVANINMLWNNAQSTLVAGNLLVVPLGKSVLYVRPLFQQSRSNPIPELRRVVLSLSNRVVLANSYEEALQQLFEGASQVEIKPPAASSSVPPSPGSARTDLKGSIKEAATLLDQADAALRAGDFAKYGELQRKARGLLNSMLK